MKKPAVSILMPVYNAAPWLPACLGSLLAEHGPVFELVAVDDGSKDDSARILKAYAKKGLNLRLVTHRRNLGLVPALNHGLAAARAPLIARLDGDDILVPGRLAAQAQAFADHSDLALCASNLDVIDGQGRLLERTAWRFPSEGLWAQLRIRNVLCHSSVMFPRLLASRLGGYDRSVELTEDFDLWGRLSQRGRVAVLPGRWVRWRQHQAQASVVQGGLQGSRALAISARRFRELGVPVTDPESLRALVFPEQVATVTPEALIASGRLWTRFVDAAYLKRPAWADSGRLADWLLEEHAKRAVAWRRHGPALGRPSLTATAGARWRGTLRGLLGLVPRARPLSLRLLPRTHFP